MVKENALKEKKEKIIAVCCATLRELSVLEPVDAICKSANEYGYKVQIFQAFEELTREDEVNIGEKAVFELINYDSLCGVIVFGEKIKNAEIVENLILKAKLHGLPVVAFDDYQKGCYNVTFDYEEAFIELVRHLVEYHKVKDIFVMAGIKGNTFSEVRLEAVRRVLRENDLFLPDYKIAYGDFWEIPTKNAMEKFFEEHNPLPEAFIAFNDTMATVIIDEVQKRGYSVPGDVLVTGFDGIFLAENYVPKITTAKQQYDVAGKQAVDFIKEYVEGESTEPRDMAIPFKVQISQSCGCHDVDVTGVTGKIRGLHADFSTCKRYSVYMEQMTKRMMVNHSMSGLLESVQSYTWAVDNHHAFYLALNKAYLKEDVMFIDQMKEKGIDLSEKNKKDMVLVLKSTGEGIQTGPMEEFERQEILPTISDYMASSPNLLITLVHIGNDIYGHIVLDYTIGNRDTYKTKIFVNKIANMQYLLRQHWMLERSNQELTKIKNQLEAMYALDPMTGINNRRGFYQKYPGMLRGKRGGYVTVLSVDLDRLKPINDTYGHQEGDFAIKTLSSSLEELVGSRGICARFGGDEFVAMLYQNDPMENATEVLYEEMMAKLSSAEKEAHKPYKIQCSLGAVEEPLLDRMDIESMLSRSDKALYEMKRLHHEEEEA